MALQRRGVSLASSSDTPVNSTLSSSMQCEHDETSISQGSSLAMHSSSRSSSRSAGSSWYEDRWNISLLVLLYTIQGFPMGFVFGSIPFLLKERISYEALAVFSFAGWPYSIKLFVAPVVDALYSPQFGRRKSWIIPAQAVSGTLFLTLAGSISKWVETGQVSMLTVVFFCMMSVTAIQDIAVDSWALTLLKSKNLPFASTCQSVGLGIGYFASFTIFLALQDASFSNSYVRPWVGGAGPLLTLDSMMRYIGALYVVVTMFILFLKKETDSVSGSKPIRHGVSRGPPEEEDSENLLPVGSSVSLNSRSSALAISIASTYRELYRVTKLPAIRQLILVLLTAKVGFSAYDNVSALKFLDAGFPKQAMAGMAVFQAPVSLITSIVAGRVTAEYGPVRPYMAGFCIRAVLSLSGPPLVSYLHSLSGQITPFFYGLVLSSTILYSIGADLCFVAISALFLTIGDKDIGGSYLTLLATCSNLGGMWPKSVALFLVDKLSWYDSCDLPADASPGAKCPLWLDGYYVLSLLLAPLTIPLGIFVRGQLSKLSALPKSAWRTSPR